MAYLTCEDLAVGYAGVPVAEHISFAVGAGDMLCVIGENGAGKSTFVKTLLGLLPPVSGRISRGDGLGPREVGYLPQRGETQRDFPASAGEIVLSGRLSHLGRRPFYRSEDRAYAAETMRRVGAYDLREQAFNELSGGQQQRVLLARALCATARLLVLDEPTTGLDPEAANSLYALLDELRADGMALIVVSHDVDEALAHATHVLTFGSAAPVYADVASWREREAV